MQVCSQVLLDLLRFDARPKKSNEHIVRRANVSEAAVGGIIGIDRCNVLGLPQQSFGLLILPLSSCPAESLLDTSVGWVFLANLTSRVLRDQVGFHLGVKLVQVDSAESWRNRSALGNPRESWEGAPFLQISSLKQMVDETQEAWIVNFLSQDAQHD